MKINAVSLKDKNMRTSLSIELLDEHIIIGANKVSISNFQITIGGSRSELFFFKNSEFNFYIRKSKDLSKYLKNTDNKILHDIYNQSKKAHTSELKVIYAIVLFAISLIVVPIYNQKRITNFIINKVPYTLEQEISEEVFSSFLKKDYSGKEIKILAAIRKMSSPLLKQVPKEYQDIKFYISNSSEVNAYALMGGHITLTKGFLKSVSSCDELYGVIGHELAHITKRHGLKSMFKSISLFGVISLFFGDVSGIAAVIIQNSSKLYSLSFSREYELEADKVSLDYTSNIGYNSDGLISFFEKLDKNKEKDKSKERPKEEYVGTRVKSFLSTHPMGKDRIKELKEISQNLVLSKTKVKCDYSQIKNLLK